MLDVRRMRILREVAEQGSFSGAADSLHLTQSAVSQQVAALERETGATLVDRNRGQLRLSEAEPEESIPQLRAGEYDLALVYDYVNVPLPEDRDIERTLLLEEHM